eukprot:TRINITY_DN40574_c0_g1_i1.p1 TRINITY_DN40574_c0_g1~~TRINITY_DN40574_c0_g1_i1.p1  ORF type:complete len:474 (-),score=55.59 TRINITY_DN40574_c0_g1_i1:9-1430(-)
MSSSVLTPTPSLVPPLRIDLGGDSDRGAGGSPTEHRHGGGEGFLLLPEHYLQGDPWEGCEDLQKAGLTEWLADFELSRSYTPESSEAPPANELEQAAGFSRRSTISTLSSVSHMWAASTAWLTASQRRTETTKAAWCADDAAVSAVEGDRGKGDVVPAAAAGGFAFRPAPAVADDCEVPPLLTACLRPANNARWGRGVEHAVQPPQPPLVAPLSARSLVSADESMIEVRLALDTLQKSSFSAAPSVGSHRQLLSAVSQKCLSNSGQRHTKDSTCTAGRYARFASAVSLQKQTSRLACAQRTLPALQTAPTLTTPTLPETPQRIHRVISPRQSTTPPPVANHVLLRSDERRSLGAQSPIHASPTASRQLLARDPSSTSRAQSPYSEATSSQELSARVAIRRVPTCPLGILGKSLETSVVRHANVVSPQSLQGLGSGSLVEGKASPRTTASTGSYVPSPNRVSVQRRVSRASVEI